jgi:hypothetical protein
MRLPAAGGSCGIAALGATAAGIASAEIAAYVPTFMRMVVCLLVVVVGNSDRLKSDVHADLALSVALALLAIRLSLLSILLPFADIDGGGLEQRQGNTDDRKHEWAKVNGRELAVGG